MSRGVERKTSGYYNKESEDELKDILEKEAFSSRFTTSTPTTKEIIEKICSDQYADRLVGCRGNEKTAEYISEIMSGINLKPVFGDRYFVPYTQWVYPQFNVMDDKNCQYKSVYNVAGRIEGSDNTKAIVVSAHFDNIGGSKTENVKLMRGALDNASGVAAVIKIADTLKAKSENKTFARDIVFVFFNGEETDFQGSRAFVRKLKERYSDLYNINIDCVGGKRAGKITLHNSSTISGKLTEEMKKVFKYNNLSYSEVPLKGGASDNKTFENQGIHNIYISQDNIYEYIHNEYDNPQYINFEDIDKLAEVICDFIINNDNVDF
ncbi:MAG: M28 family metallopeptidase [Clostridium sp.]